MPQKSATRMGGLKRNSFVMNETTKKRKKRLTRHSVLKMLAVMEASQNAGPSPGSNDESGETKGPPTPSTENVAHRDDFLASGRTGRRNALPDILGQNATVTSSDLPIRLEALTTSDDQPHKKDEDEASTSKR